MDLLYALLSLDQKNCTFIQMHSDGVPLFLLVDFSHHHCSFRGFKNDQPGIGRSNYGIWEISTDTQARIKIDYPIY